LTPTPRLENALIGEARQGNAGDLLFSSHAPNLDDLGCRIGNKEPRPLIHDSPPLIEEFGALVGGHDLVADRMRKRRFTDIVRKTTLGSPIAECTPHPMGSDITSTHAP
jgi:hypothetical protein